MLLTPDLGYAAGQPCWDEKVRVLSGMQRSTKGWLVLDGSVRGDLLSSIALLPRPLDM